MGVLRWKSTRSCRNRWRLFSPTMMYWPSSSTSIMKCLQRSSALRDQGSRGRTLTFCSDCVTANVEIRLVSIQQTLTDVKACSQSCSRWPWWGSSQVAWTWAVPLLSYKPPQTNPLSYTFLLWTAFIVIFTERSLTWLSHRSFKQVRRESDRRKKMQVEFTLFLFQWKRNQ